MRMLAKLRRCSPLPVIGVLAAVSAYLLLVVLTQPRDNTNTTPPVHSPSPSVVPTSQWCLLVEEPHFYSRHPYNAQLARPGSTYKESPNAAGPSAVPIDYATLGAYDRQAAVRAEFVLRLCGNATLGGDPVLFAMVQSHAAKLLGLTVAVDFNNQVAVKARRQAVLDYLNMIVWSESAIVEEDPPQTAQTAMMVDNGSAWPKLQVTAVNPVRSRYLKLALVASGSTVYQLLRLDCGFQVRFDRHEDVPQGLLR